MTNRPRLLAAAAVVSLLGAASSARAQTIAIDDGVSDLSVGVPAQFPTAVYLNSFQTPALGTTTVNTVQIAFGGPSASTPPPSSSEGRPIMVYVWSDPDGNGNPSDAVVLGSVMGFVSASNTNTFVPFVLPTGVVLGPATNFFIGFSVASTTTPEVEPAGLDNSAPLANRSFLGFYANAFNPNNLASEMFNGQSTLRTTESLGIPGNFLIRGDVVVVPEPATVLGGALAAGALGWQLVRRRRATAGA